MTSHAYDDRLKRAQESTAATGVDVLFITPGPGFRYLTGYDARVSERLTCLVLPRDGEPALVLPRLEVPAAEAAGLGELGIRIVPWDETEEPVFVAAGLTRRRAIAALDDQMWAEKALKFRDAMADTEFVTAGPILTDLRIVKSPDELDCLRAAGAAIDRVHARVPEWLAPGRTEAEVGRDIADAIIAEGHVRVDFVIVASGPNGASPHHDTSDRVIQPGDPVVVDIGGATADGYCSDETRTYVIGEPTDDFVKAYDALQRAQQAAVDHVRPGVMAEEVDAVARGILTDAGLGEYFVHRTGHGIGLETHEEPYIVSGNWRPLEPGMAFSVEPGFYLPGRYGARIEDIVLVTETGVEPVNRRPHDIVSVG
jgi:Xaa-Pro aminopeptidase